MLVCGVIPSDKHAPQVFLVYHVRLCDKRGVCYYEEQKRDLTWGYIYVGMSACLLCTTVTSKHAELEAARVLPYVFDDVATKRRFRSLLRVMSM